MLLFLIKLRFCTYYTHVIRDAIKTVHSLICTVGLCTVLRIERPDINNKWPIITLHSGILV